MAQQRFEAWPPIHLKVGTLGGDLARHLNAGLNGVVQNAVLEVDQHKKRSETLDRVETVPLHWTLDDNGVRFPGWTLDDNAAATPSGADTTLDVRYWLVEDHFNASDATAPIFLGLGGEGAVDGAQVQCPGLASVHGALCVMTEHRFYGESWPANRSLDAFKTGLSVEQSLADTSAILDAVQAAYSSPAGPRPVIAFGGSYSGALCAWLRQAYPDQAAGCVAQSAVVQAIYDFPAMDTRAKTALSSPDGGECLASLQATFAALGETRTAPQFTALTRRFNASKIATTPLGRLDFAFNTADAALMLVQYGQKDALCEHMQQLAPNATDDERIDQLASLIATYYGDHFLGACEHDSRCLKAHLGSDNLKLDASTTGVSWWWQTCSQLGYLQRAPKKSYDADPFEKPMRSADITLPALVSQCDYLFGRGTGATGLRANGVFNGRFGGARPRSGAFPNSSRIFFMNWSDDPWQEASATPHTLSAEDEANQLQYCMTTCDGWCASAPRSTQHTTQRLLPHVVTLGLAAPPPAAPHMLLSRLAPRNPSLWRSFSPPHPLTPPPRSGHCGTGATDSASQHCADRLQNFLEESLRAWGEEAAAGLVKAEAEVQAIASAVKAKADKAEAAAKSASPLSKARAEAQAKAKAKAEAKVQAKADAEADAEAHPHAKPSPGPSSSLKEDGEKEASAAMAWAAAHPRLLKKAGISDAEAHPALVKKEAVKWSAMRPEIEAKNKAQPQQQQSQQPQPQQQQEEGSSADQVEAAQRRTIEAAKAFAKAKAAMAAEDGAREAKAKAKALAAEALAKAEAEAAKERALVKAAELAAAKEARAKELAAARAEAAARVKQMELEAAAEQKRLAAEQVTLTLPEP